ncbi:uncharacterized protein [Leptinotarsa decemlineata]|uniref:uncharacterized protein n=1 Tax=Leptinotarsa decemlineata TaxID=7539 RepID=UPI003D30CE51
MKKAKKSKKSSSKSPSKRRHNMKHEKRDKDKSIKVREMKVIAGPSTSVQQVQVINPEYKDVSPGSTSPPPLDPEKSKDRFSFMRFRRDKFLEIYYVYHEIETEFIAKRGKLVELEELFSVLEVKCE